MGGAAFVIAAAVVVRYVKRRRRQAAQERHSNVDLRDIMGGATSVDRPEATFDINNPLQENTEQQKEKSASSAYEGAFTRRNPMHASLQAAPHTNDAAAAVVQRADDNRVEREDDRGMLKKTIGEISSLI